MSPSHPSPPSHKAQSHIRHRVTQELHRVTQTTWQTVTQDAPPHSAQGHIGTIPSHKAHSYTYTCMYTPSHMAQSHMAQSHMYMHSSQKAHSHTCTPSQLTPGRLPECKVTHCPITRAHHHTHMPYLTSTSLSIALSHKHIITHTQGHTVTQSHNHKGHTRHTSTIPIALQSSIM